MFACLSNGLTGSEEDNPKKNTNCIGDGIINNNSTSKYPRVGKKDRDGQLVINGNVKTFERRLIAKQDTQNNATQHNQIIINAEQQAGI